MAINDLLGKNLRVLGLGAILSCSGASDGNTAGCKNDSECKGNRYCIDGECVEDNGSSKDTYSSKDTLIPQKDAYVPSKDTYVPKLDSIKYQDTINCQDECSLGEKKCLDTQVMECFNSGEGCTVWNLAEECSAGAYCNADFECECDPYVFQNQCQNGVLTYCDVVSRKPTKFDCYAEGYPHCDYVEIFGNSICFGNGGQGSSCQEGVIVSGEGKPQNGFGVVKSECDYEKVDACLFPYDWWESSAFCTISCETPDDCLGEWSLGCDPSFPEGGYCIKKY